MENFYSLCNLMLLLALRNCICVGQMQGGAGNFYLKRKKLTLKFVTNYIYLY